VPILAAEGESSTADSGTTRRQDLLATVPTSTENMKRGFFRITGVVRVNIFTGLAVASYNIRRVRNWNERTDLGNPDHPLLAPEELDYGHVRLTRTEAEKLALRYTPGEAA
jgi:hypothetical protein